MELGISILDPSSYMDKNPFVVMSFLYPCIVWVDIVITFSPNGIDDESHPVCRLQCVRCTLSCRYSDALHGVSTVFDADGDDPSVGRPLWRYPDACDATRGAGASVAGVTCRVVEWGLMCT